MLQPCWNFQIRGRQALSQDAQAKFLFVHIFVLSEQDFRDFELLHVLWGAGGDRNGLTNFEAVLIHQINPSGSGAGFSPVPTDSGMCCLIH